MTGECVSPITHSMEDTASTPKRGQQRDQHSGEFLGEGGNLSVH